MVKNNHAFIDGQNLFLGTSNARPAWKVDMRRFRIYLRDKYHVTEAHYFMGAFDSKHQELYNSLERFSYNVVFREHAESMVSRKKGNVDTDIVFTIMKKLVERENFDKILLVSGDGDYIKMVKYLIFKNKLLKVLAPSQKSMSSLYRHLINNAYYDFLDNSDVKRKVGLAKK